MRIWEICPYILINQTKDWISFVSSRSRQTDLIKLLLLLMKRHVNSSMKLLPISSQAMTVCMGTMSQMATLGTLIKRASIGKPVQWIWNV